MSPILQPNPTPPVSSGPEPLQVVTAPITAPVLVVTTPAPASTPAALPSAAGTPHAAPLLVAAAPGSAATPIPALPRASSTPQPDSVLTARVAELLPSVLRSVGLSMSDLERADRVHRRLSDAVAAAETSAHRPEGPGEARIEIRDGRPMLTCYCTSPRATFVTFGLSVDATGQVLVDSIGTSNRRFGADPESQTLAVPRPLTPDFVTRALGERFPEPMLTSARRLAEVPWSPAASSGLGTAQHAAFVERFGTTVEVRRIPDSLRPPGDSYSTFYEYRVGGTGGPTGFLELVGGEGNRTIHTVRPYRWPDAIRLLDAGGENVEVTRGVRTLGELPPELRNFATYTAEVSTNLPYRNRSSLAQVVTDRLHRESSGLPIESVRAVTPRVRAESFATFLATNHTTAELADFREIHVLSGGGEAFADAQIRAHAEVRSMMTQLVTRFRPDLGEVRIRASIREDEPPGVVFTMHFDVPRERVIHVRASVGADGRLRFSSAGPERSAPAPSADRGKPLTLDLIVANVTPHRPPALGADIRALAGIPWSSALPTSIAPALTASLGRAPAAGTTFREVPGALHARQLSGTRVFEFREPGATAPSGYFSVWSGESGPTVGEVVRYDFEAVAAAVELRGKTDQSMIRADTAEFIDSLRGDSRNYAAWTGRVPYETPSLRGDGERWTTSLAEVCVDSRQIVSVEAFLENALQGKNAKLNLRVTAPGTGVDVAKVVPPLVVGLVELCGKEGIVRWGANVVDALERRGVTDLDARAIYTAVDVLSSSITAVGGLELTSKGGARLTSTHRLDGATPVIELLAAGAPKPELRIEFGVPDSGGFDVMHVRRGETVVVKPLEDLAFPSDQIPNFISGWLGLPPPPFGVP